MALSNTLGDPDMQNKLIFYRFRGFHAMQTIELLK